MCVRVRVFGRERERERLEHNVPGETIAFSRPILYLH